MNQKKVKAIRRAMRKELAEVQTYRIVFHPEVFVNLRNELCVKYKTQFITQGGKRLMKVGKAIYRLSGILPKETRHATK